MSDIRYRATEIIIQNALLTQLNKKEYDEINVSDVIKTAKTTRTTFYNHYRSLFDLTEQLISNYLKPFETFFNKAIGNKKIPDDQNNVHQKLLSEVSSHILKHRSAYQLIRQIPLGQNSFDRRLEDYLLKCLNKSENKQLNRLSIYLIPNILLADLNFVLNENRTPDLNELNDSLRFIVSIMTD